MTRIPHPAHVLRRSLVTLTAATTFMTCGLSASFAEDLTAQTTGEESAESGTDASAADYATPTHNYTWRSDILAQVMAGRPGPVLHRVDGSWFSAPDVPVEASVASDQGRVVMGPSTPIYVGQSAFCTLTVTGYDAYGRKVGITAGHCGGLGSEVRSADEEERGAVGVVVGVNTRLDYAIIYFTDSVDVVRTYNGVTVNSVGGANPAFLDTVCKTGVATGTTCGTSWTNGQNVTYAQVCAMQGDSGAPVLSGDRLVALVSGGMFPTYALSCQTPLQGQLFMPTVTQSVQAIVDNLNEVNGPGAGFRLP